MVKLNRRKFLKVAGASSAVAAGATLPTAGLLASSAATHGTVTFRAVAGMPREPLPNYASYVIAGHVNLDSKTGVITTSVFAGAPETMSTIALPGMSRIARVTDVVVEGSVLRITGVVDDRSQLRRGESNTFIVWLDRSLGTVKAEFFGDSVTLRLAQ